MINFIVLVFDTVQMTASNKISVDGNITQTGDRNVLNMDSGNMYVTNNYYGLNANDVRLLLTMIRRQQEQIDKLMSLLNVEINQDAKKIETISRRLEVK
ncbi:hypothetical protein SAMN04487825_12162 [Prevotella sp. kh1p2]|nr:hypothetical protein SAMN04487825_12162 [Prevotella sp. kh1p2]